MRNINIKAMGLTIAAASFLTACGGGDSTTPTVSTVTLGGTVAVGSPVVGAMVKVTCAGGSAIASQPTNGVGAWQVTLSGQTFPCAAQATGGTISGVTNTAIYHSVALAPGVMNITPLTDLILANMAQSAAPNAWFAALNSARLTSINVTGLNNATNLLIRILGLTQLGTTINPMTSSFTPAAGSVMDDTLTALNSSLANAATTYTALLAQASAGSAFAAPAGFAARINAAYATTSSGIAAGSAGNGTPTNTAGKAANGTPVLALSNCAVKVGSNQYVRCAANSLANFSTVSIVDSTDGQTCTASYNIGVLTVSKGAVTITSWINGNMLSTIETLGSGASETIGVLAGYSSAGLNVTTSSVTWNAAGAIRQIRGQATVLTGGGQQLSCSQS